jgi:hypothetical protein
LLSFDAGSGSAPRAAEATHTFPTGTELVAGGRFTVARNGAAFLARFGSLSDAEFENTSAAPDIGQSRDGRA